MTGKVFGTSVGGGVKDWVFAIGSLGADLVGGNWDKATAAKGLDILYSSEILLNKATKFAADAITSAMIGEDSDLDFF